MKDLMSIIDCSQSSKHLEFWELFGSPVSVLPTLKLYTFLDKPIQIVETTSSAP